MDAHKEAFQWVAVIRLPDFVAREDFDWAVREATKKKKIDCSTAEYLMIDEGLCVQCLHVGSYDANPPRSRPWIPTRASRAMCST